MSSMKKQLVVRLSDKGRILLSELASFMGLTQTGVVETLIREKSKELEITIPTHSEYIAKVGE